MSEPQGSSYMVLEGVGLLPRSVASITSLKAALVMCRASNNCEVPMLSKVSDCILEMCTPRSRWMPEHSMQMIMPKLVDSQVASVAEKNWSMSKSARCKFRAHHFASCSRSIDRCRVVSARTGWWPAAAPAGWGWFCCRCGRYRRTLSSRRPPCCSPAPTSTLFGQLRLPLGSDTFGCLKHNYLVEKTELGNWSNLRFSRLEMAYMI